MFVLRLKGNIIIIYFHCLKIKTKIHSVFPISPFWRTVNPWLIFLYLSKLQNESVYSEMTKRKRINEKCILQSPFVNACNGIRKNNFAKNLICCLWPMWLLGRLRNLIHSSDAIVSVSCYCSILKRTGHNQKRLEVNKQTQEHFTCSLCNDVGHN